MADTRLRADETVEPLSPGESRAYFDRLVHEWLGLDSDDFLRRWDSGEFDAIADDPDHPEIMRLAQLIPLAR
jgi:hypothetical protein